MATVSAPAQSPVERRRVTARPGLVAGPAVTVTVLRKDEKGHNVWG